MSQTDVSQASAVRCPSHLLHPFCCRLPWKGNCQIFLKKVPAHSPKHRRKHTRKTWLTSTWHAWKPWMCLSLLLEAWLNKSLSRVLILQINFAASSLKACFLLQTYVELSAFEDVGLLSFQVALLLFCWAQGKLDWRSSQGWCGQWLVLRRRCVCQCLMFRSWPSSKSSLIVDPKKSIMKLTAVLWQKS